MVSFVLVQVVKTQRDYEVTARASAGPDQDWSAAVWYAPISGWVPRPPLKSDRPTLNDGAVTQHHISLRVGKVRMSR